VVPAPGTKAWFAQVTEAVIDPHRLIIDPHHHLWDRPDRPPYLLPELWADTGAGHNIQKTVFVECGTHYRPDGPEALKPVGETEYIAGLAAQGAAAGPGRAVVAGIISFADLTLGDAVEEVLAAHEKAGQGLFRGIRHAGARHPIPGEIKLSARHVPAPFRDPTFQAGVRRLGRRGLSYESWHYHTQLRDFTALAQAVPETSIILNHCGTPLGTKSFRDQREAVFQEWSAAIAELARCPNVTVKLGGLAVPDTGYGWHEAPRLPTSDELVSAQKRYYLHTIECFGVERCMFESNAPVDTRAIAYPVLWNAFKKMVADFSETEQQALFYGTAARVYRL
jgi:predicted TIM-barrel fold metal-dependent hydrolase